MTFLSPLFSGKIHNIVLFALHVSIFATVVLTVNPSKPLAEPPSCENMPGEPFFDLYQKPSWEISLRLWWDGFSLVDSAEELERRFSGNTLEYFEDNCLPYRTYFNSDGTLTFWSALLGPLPPEKDDTWKLEKANVCKHLGGGLVRSCLVLFVRNEKDFVIVNGGRVHWARMHEGEDLPMPK